MFDLDGRNESSVSWSVDLPIDKVEWDIGLIVGPSGCGKSTIARNLWPVEFTRQEDMAWGGGSILDDFPEGLGIKDIATLLSSVGFSSPPAWLRPYHVLSTGQKFRVSMARLLAETRCGLTPLAVCDEFTSVVDRTVAQIGSAAVARTIRQQGLKFVAVSCHEDIIEWLNPNWIYRPDVNEFTWRLLRQRPEIDLSIVRCEARAWGLFAPHHYLSHSCNPSSWCWLASWRGQPVAFTSWLPFVAGGPRGRREHRTVCLPDYQGIGIGAALCETIASMWTALGLRAVSTTTHPGVIAHRRRSRKWHMHRKPSMSGSVETNPEYRNLKHSTTRITAGFTYVGRPMPKLFAKSLFGE